MASPLADGPIPIAVQAIAHRAMVKLETPRQTRALASEHATALAYTVTT